MSVPELDSIVFKLYILAHRNIMTKPTKLIPCLFWHDHDIPYAQSFILKKQDPGA